MIKFIENEYDQKYSKIQIMEIWTELNSRVVDYFLHYILIKSAAWRLLDGLPHSNACFLNAAATALPSNQIYLARTATTSTE